MKSVYSGNMEASADFIIASAVTGVAVLWIIRNSYRKIKGTAFPGKLKNCGPQCGCSVRGLK